MVGAGISGLVCAHLLHEEHEITVFEANDYAGGHTHTVRVDTADETHPRGHRLHRPQRPQLPAASSGCWTSVGRGHAAAPT